MPLFKLKIMTKIPPSIEDLQRDLKQADQLANQKSNFLATMSHEIRTPMQSVYGLLELIEAEKPDSNIMSMVKTAKDSASGLLEILDDILDFAKMDADQMTLDEFEVPVRTLAYGINEAMAVKVQGKDVQLLDDIDEDTPFVVVGDPKRLRQILINLMSNAIKFTHQGSVTKGSNFWFEIPTEEVSTSTENLEDMPDLDGLSILSVEDHPQGAKEIIRSLQSMGASVENCPTYAEALELGIRRPFDVIMIDQGLPDGLGLDLMRELMELRPFTGYIMYTVREDAGLQHTLQSLGAAYVTKPASRIGLGEAIQDAASKVQKISIEGSKKLLIAEDTESVRDVLKRQLDKLNFEATFVENGRLAIEAIETGEYGILITDLHMPEMDGYQVIEKIRADDKKLGRHFPVISLTADVQMGQRQVYMKHGFDECLLKPVSLGQLQRLLVRWGLLSNETKIQQKIQTSYSDKKSALDYHAIEKQMGGLDEGTIEMLGMFVDMTRPIIDKIITAGKTEEFHDIKEAAHSLKGAARSACANILGDIASDIQDNADKKKPCSELIEKMQREFERVSLEIKNL